MTKFVLSTLILLMVLTPSAVLTAGLSKTLLYQAPDECKWSGQSEQDVILVCHLRTINSELENTNFSVIQPQNTIRLKLECNDGLFFQSSLSPGSFKNLIELRSLAIEYCKLSNLTEGSFRGLHDLKNLTIRSHNSDWSSMSMDITGNVFQDFRQLELLDLSQNNIWTIPDGMVCPLKQLNHLNMSHNQIQNINNFQFSASLSTRKSRICGTSLSELDLSNNKMANLQPAQLSGLGRLKRLNLKHNEMNFIADRALEGLISLSLVDLSENKLHNLPPELFAETKYIKEIYLNNNSINVLAPGVFNDLAELMILDLGTNELNSQWINANTFSGLKRLIILDVSKNKIHKLEATIFKSLRSLEVLRLNDNLIDEIPDELFSELSNLHTLQLSNNRLLKINEFTLKGLNSILVLSMDYNKITAVHQLALRNCSNLQDLHLNGNKLQTVPDALQYVPLLKTLDLGENLIKNIDNTSLIHLENLYGLRLTENQIAQIRKGYFDKMESMQILNLSKNKIKQIDASAFSKNKEIQAIRLDGNYLSSISGLFTQLPSLVWLNISDNLLETFDYNDIPTGLQWLDVHSNRIKQLGNYFEIESELSLSTFDASSNWIKEITTTSIPNSVSLLYLNDNQISKIQPYTFFKKINLTRVDLFGNNLTTLDPNALRLSPISDDKLIPEFYIGKNPFQCDCNLDWITKTTTTAAVATTTTQVATSATTTVNNAETRRTQPKLMDLASIQCKLSYNRERMYLPLTEAKSSEFHCRYYTHCFALCHCCDFFACDCKMECPHKCKCFHDQSWTSNIVDCSQSGYTNQLPSKIPMDSTQLYLDGNNFKQLNSHTFLGRKRLKILYLNHSNIELIMNRTFYGLLELEILQLNNNNLQQLNGNEFHGLENLKELFLQRNRLKTIDQLTFSNLHSLTILRLDHNELTQLSLEYFLPPYLNNLQLAENPWQCNCDLIENFKILLNKNNNIQDMKNITCAMTVAPPPSLSPKRHHLAKSNEMEFVEQLLYNNTMKCSNLEKLSKVDGSNSTTRLMLSPQTLQNYTVLLVILASCSILIIFTLLVFIFRQEMRIWCHSKFGVRLFYNTNLDIDKNERDKLFDAFISYSSKDEQFIAEELAPLLENGDPHYKLCLYYRDFPPGATIYTDTICQAIDSSRRTVMLLSENFLKSEWSRYEFKSAHHQVLRDRRKRLIVILVGDLPPSKDLDPDLRLYLKTNTYLQWGDKSFWDKLRFALPDVPNNQRRINCNNFQMQQMHMQQQQQQQHLQHARTHPQHSIQNLNRPQPLPPNRNINVTNQMNLLNSSGGGGGVPVNNNRNINTNSPSPRSMGMHI